jgi:hypothetical protein
MNGVNPIIASMITHSGRSWWQARYRNGKKVSEWDTLTTALLLPMGESKTSRWEEVPKDGMIALRLLCPDGMCGDLEAKEDHKFFQLKSGRRGIGNSNDPNSTYQLAHVIGVVLDANGKCLCRSWDFIQKRLCEFEDNIYAMKYCQIGRLSLEVQGLRV